MKYAALLTAAEVTRWDFARPTSARRESSAPAALAAAVLPLLDDPARRRAFGEAARQSVRERFDWPRTVAGYLAVYDEVLGRDTR